MRADRSGREFITPLGGTAAAWPLPGGPRKPKEESDGESLQTSKAGANGTAPQKSELHGTVEEAADREAEEILYPISF